MERFLDDQESPLPAPPRERSASPVTSLIYGDPKRNHLRPPSEGEGASSVRIEPEELDVSGASPTVVAFSPDLKCKQAATSSSSSITVNGVHSIEEPIAKKTQIKWGEFPLRASGVVFRGSRAAGLCVLLSLLQYSV